MIAVLDNNSDIYLLNVDPSVNTVCCLVSAVTMHVCLLLASITILYSLNEIYKLVYPHSLLGSEAEVVLFFIYCINLWVYEDGCNWGWTITK